MIINNHLKLITGYLIIGILLSGCSHGSSKSLIQHHFNALNRHDLTQLVADYDVKVQVTSSGWDGIHNGTGEINTTHKRFFHTTPDLRFDIGNVYFSSDSIAVVEYTQAGTLAAPENSEPNYMTGKKYILNTCTIFTIRQGKIVKEATYFDQVSFLRQVGFFEHVK